MKTEAELAALERQSALQAAREELGRVARMCEELAHELRKSSTDLEVPGGGITVTPADRMEWAINDIENMIRNINFATLARRHARLSGGRV